MLFKDLAREYKVECAVWFTMAENYNQLGILPPAYKEGNLLIKRDIDNIEKAIQKAKGAAEGENYEAIRYEGYGPSGVAIIVDCLTDNRNRTAGDVRSRFTKRGGNLGTTGSVSYMFSRRGIITIPSDYEEDEVMMAALDAGALDFVTDEDVYVITTLPEDFIKVKEALEETGVKEFLTSEVTFVPNNTVELTDEEQIEKVHSLIEQLEELDDVQDVYCNLKEN